MSAPPFVPQASLLPPGWTEHSAPGGQLYYHNSQTKESTYVRPIPTFPILPIMQSEPSKKKEKPLVKTPIPGTEWFRVRTTEGNTFYAHKLRKESVWTVPSEIKDAVNALEQKEQSKSGLDQSSKEEREQTAEIHRIKEEIQFMVKRKAEENIPLDGTATKKARVEEAEEEDGNDSDESEEEDWQREAAAQLAAEAEEKIKQEQEEERLEKEAEAQRQAQLNIPDRVDLSIEEAKALFKAGMGNEIFLPLTLLKEKDINPLHPWDTSLPKFVSDPRYVLLPSVSARREAFDEYCRERARELRQSVVKKEKEMNPKEDFEQLLLREVKSTRTSWTDFRRTWKKDRAFYGWGRDDREREKRFREYLKELGEKKRLMAQKAEMDFFSLLQEKGDVKEGSSWKDVKRKLHDDPRYDAVGSTSLREELYNTYIKSHYGKEAAQNDTSNNDPKEELPEMDEDQRQRLREEKMERAVKEREQKVRLERERLEAAIGRSRIDGNREEGERDFKTMLVDAIRDPQITWNAALPQLKTDPRFRNSPVPPNQQLHLFHDHVEHLRSRHIKSLHALFEEHASTLATRFNELPLSSLLSAPPVVKLGYDTRGIQQNFDKWKHERYSESRKAFDEMLSENSFVEFWGRLGKIGGEGVDGGVKADDADGEDGEGGGGKVDMKVLAKNVDVGEIEKVLKNDKRYIIFDHVPEQRESWIRDYLSNLTPPKLSVHMPEGHT